MLLQANIKLEAYGYAIADASNAIELDPSYIKVVCPYRIIASVHLTERRLSTGEP